MGQLPGVHEAFGLRFSVEFELPLPPAPGAVDVELRLADRATVDAAFSGPDEPRRVHAADAGGEPYAVERGRAGDHRFTVAGRDCFHLDSSRRRLLAAPADPDEPAWRRFLLDTVFGTVSLLHGFEALHASGFGGVHGLVAVVAPMGEGKSTLLAEELRRGRTMITDDILALTRRAGDVVGHPGPPVMTIPLGARPPGTVIARLGDEQWVTVDRPSVRPAVVRTIVILERTRSGDPIAERVGSTPGALLPHSLDTGPDRLAGRFELFSDLAAQASIVRLACPPYLPPTDVADLLDGELASLAADAAPPATG